MRLLISGGGTGGHIYPALAVAPLVKPVLVEERRGAHASVEILWLGSHTGVEQELVPAAGIEFASIRTGQLRGANPLTALTNGGQIAVGIREALGSIERFRPDVCLVTGGYVCTPVALACRIRRVPLLIYLPDMTPGLAVRWLSRVADRVAVSFPEARRYFGVKAVVTGYPVRQDLLEATANKESAQARLSAALHLKSTGEGEDPDPLPLVLVVGGSSGARSINFAVWSGLPALLSVARVVHVVGRRDWSLCSANLPPLADGLAARYRPVPYLHEEMAWALAAADLVVARAGASVLGELPAAGLPAILVPLPIAGGHQRANARKLADGGGAFIVADDKLASELIPTVAALVQDSRRRQQMAAAMAALAWPAGARNIARELVTMTSDIVGRTPDYA